MIWTIDSLARRLNLKWFDYQWEALVAAHAMPGPQQRRCLYYKTGSGKSVTALGQMALWDVDDVLVVTPPSTNDSWIELGKKLGMNIECMSHAKFRMADTKVSRNRAIIADEMHLFGGHDGKGWQKLDRVAKHLQAPMVLASATPNYNDADRVYCVKHILDPNGTKGGFLDFIYAHCTTEQNPFGRYPLVTGFHRFKDAAEFLASLPGVDYLPDDLIYMIKDVPYPEFRSLALQQYGLNLRKNRMVASQIEEKHANIDRNLINKDGLLRYPPYKRVMHEFGTLEKPMIVFANHSTVAEAFMRKLKKYDGDVSAKLITGKTSTKDKLNIIEAFRRQEFSILVGTASLATGTDGLDKVCDLLYIIDDTEDPSLRRQLVGRIMPRGLSTNLADKRVYRLVATP